jgi:hypothetical protein
LNSSKSTRPLPRHSKVEVRLDGRSPVLEEHQTISIHFSDHRVELSWRRLIANRTHNGSKIFGTDHPTANSVKQSKGFFQACCQRVKRCRLEFRSSQTKRYAL